MGRNVIGVPQSSILGPILSDICDLFSMLSNIDFASYADGNTPYVVKDDIKEGMESSEHATFELVQWFSINQMNANPYKCHLITSKNGDILVNVENNPIKNSKCGKLLGVKIDYKLTFNSHIDKISKKARQKMNALSRIVPYMNIEKRPTLLNTIFISQFNYCSLI